MQTLSFRKYAALIGVSHTAVAKAIQAGHIVKGIDPETKRIIVDVANAEWGNEIKERNGLIKDKDGTEKRMAGTSIAEHTNQVSGNISFAEARRQKEIYNAEIARIAALKENGIYVEKEMVYKSLFAFGQQMRVALLSIPDRVIDSILTAKTRNEAHLILSDAIHEVLTQLTAPPELRDKQ